MSLPKLLVFASGSKTGGGSGFRKLVENMEAGVLRAEIVGVASNHANGGVHQIADEMKVKFLHFMPPYTAEAYQEIVASTGAQWVALSGWLKKVAGLPVEKTINIHPGPLPAFGGPGMYGHHVHEAVMEAYRTGQLEFSMVTMHFVDAKFDTGPLFFVNTVKPYLDDTADDLGTRVNKIEHGWQSYISDLVVNKEIRLVDSGTRVIVPGWYKNRVFCPINCESG